MSDAPAPVEPLDVLRRAVTVGLPGAPSGEPPQLTDDALAIAGNHRVQGLVWSAVQGGVVIASAETTERAGEVHLKAVRSSLLAESWGYEAFELLDRVGVEARALKGLAVAHLDYDDPAERIFGDADLLIRRRDCARALVAFETAGWRRHRPAVRGWWEQRFAKAVVMVPPGGGELDLHLAIAGGYFGERIDHDELWASSSAPFDLGGRRTVGLDGVGRLLHACCHTVLGGASGLRTRRDVAQLILISRVDWRLAVQRASRQGTDLVIAEAIRATWADLHLDPEHVACRWAVVHRADPRQAEALAAYRPGTSDWSGEGRSTLAALGSVDRMGFLVGLAVPSRASLRARRRSWRSHLGQVGRLIRRPS